MHECNQLGNIARVEAQVEELTRNVNSLADMIAKNHEWQLDHERNASERFERIIRYGMSAIAGLVLALIGIVMPTLNSTVNYLQDIDSRFELLETKIIAHENTAFAHVPDKEHPK